MRAGIILGMAALGLAYAPAVAAYGTTGQDRQAPAAWKLIRVTTIPKDDVFNDVTALGTGSVWAAGDRVVNGRRRGLVQWFDGRSWRMISNAPPYELRAVTATSGKNVWVFGQG